MRHWWNFDTDIVESLKRYSAWQFKMFCNKEKWLFSTSTHTLESVYVPGNTFKGISKVNIEVIEKHFRIFVWIVWFRKKARSISFIGDRSILFIIQYWFNTMKPGQNKVFKSFNYCLHQYLSGLPKRTDLSGFSSWLCFRSYNARFLKIWSNCLKLIGNSNRPGSTSAWMFYWPNKIRKRQRII